MLFVNPPTSSWARRSARDDEESRAVAGAFLGAALLLLTLRIAKPMWGLLSEEDSARPSARHLIAVLAFNAYDHMNEEGSLRYGLGIDAGREARRGAAGGAGAQHDGPRPLLSARPPRVWLAHLLARRGAAHGAARAHGAAEAAHAAAVVGHLHGRAAAWRGARAVAGGRAAPWHRRAVGRRADRARRRLARPHRMHLRDATLLPVPAARLRAERQDACAACAARPAQAATERRRRRRRAAARAGQRAGRRCRRN